MTEQEKIQCIQETQGMTWIECANHWLKQPGLSSQVRLTLSCLVRKDESCQQ